MQRSEIEIMAPVGSYEALAAAIQAGADSVYFGVGKLNMRSASAANFTLDDLAKIVATAHAAGVKTYLTVNTIVYEDEMLTVHEVIDRAKAEGIDAIIATDFAAILYARRIGVEVHISTQSNISNSETVKFFSQWADTVVLARELTLEQVAQIHRQIVENDIRGPRGELVGSYAVANTPSRTRRPVRRWTSTGVTSSRPKTSARSISSTGSSVRASGC